MGRMQDYRALLKVAYEDIVKEKKSQNEGDKKEKQVYEALCRGESFKASYFISHEFNCFRIHFSLLQFSFCWCKNENSNAHSNLKCRYFRNHPSLYIAPVKQEHVSMRPLMFVYHDIITDGQIHTIKDLASKKVSKI